ncbi:MAG TPA: hypothetical protein VKP65_13605 [Rhodothermales bacterium]|nr:hypothetical protein [Rhodothermales bacterium]
MPESIDPRREALLAHLQSVYLLARVLAQDEDRATQLVEDTYTQAFVMLPPHQDDDEAKHALLQLLTQIHQEQTALYTDGDASAAVVDETLQSVRRHLAEEITTRTLPVVLSTLPHQQRLVLLLCEVEGFSCTEAAPLLHLDEAVACDALTQARSTLKNDFRSELTKREQNLVATSLPKGWLGGALKQAFSTTFGTVPAAIRSTLLEAQVAKPVVAETPEENNAPLPPEDGSEADHLPRLPIPRVRTLPKPEPKGLSPAIRRGLLVTLLIIVVGLTGYFASRSVEETPETNLITLSVKQAEDLTATFPTSSLRQAEEYVRGNLGQRMTLPTIDGATLTGVGVRKPAPDVSVPAFFYQDEREAGQTLVLYVYNYALLNQFEDRLSLEPDILRQIQEEQRFDLHDLGERQVLVWRNRDDIYVAVTPGDAETLRHRILFPS